MKSKKSLGWWWGWRRWSGGGRGGEWNL